MTHHLKKPLEVTRDSTEYRIARQQLSGKSTLSTPSYTLTGQLELTLEVLDRLQSWPTAMKAVCLLPLLLDDATFEYGWKGACKNGVSPSALVLAMEFRRVANSYLCAPHTDSWNIYVVKNRLGTVVPPVRNMLIAHHAVKYRFFVNTQSRHHRWAELDKYYKQWFDVLCVTPAQMLAFTEGLCNEEVNSNNHSPLVLAGSAKIPRLARELADG